MSDETLKGGCACGAACYTVSGAPMFVHCCHCLDCQRQTGGAFAINALYEATRVELSSGAPARFEMPTDSGRPHGIYRCPTCGTALWSEYAGTDKIRFMRVGTLDDPRAIAPSVHIYTRSKQPWVALPPGVPAFDAFYDAKQVWPPESLARRRALFPRPAAG